MFEFSEININNIKTRKEAKYIFGENVCRILDTIYFIGRVCLCEDDEDFSLTLKKDIKRKKTT